MGPNNISLVAEGGSLLVNARVEPIRKCPRESDRRSLPRRLGGGLGSKNGPGELARAGIFARPLRCVPSMIDSLGVKVLYPA